MGIAIKRIKILRTNGNITKIRGNATNHDILHARNQIPKKPSTKPLFISILKQEIEPLIMPERISGISHAICFGCNLIVLIVFSAYKPLICIATW